MFTLTHTSLFLRNNFTESFGKLPRRGNYNHQGPNPACYLRTNSECIRIWSKPFPIRGSTFPSFFPFLFYAHTLQSSFDSFSSIDLISLLLFLPLVIVTVPEKTKVRSVLKLFSLAAEFSFKLQVFQNLQHICQAETTACKSIDMPRLL